MPDGLHDIISQEILSSLEWQSSFPTYNAPLIPDTLLRNYSYSVQKPAIMSLVKLAGHRMGTKSGCWTPNPPSA